MLEEKIGDMFAELFDARVNPVNCVGVMGKGVAKQFATRYPTMLEWYGGLCQAKAIQPGDLRAWKSPNGDQIYNVATKDHWRDPSSYQWVKICLVNIAEKLRFQTIKGQRLRVAIPALGCGLGGLKWDIVRQMMYDHLSDLNHDIVIFQPS